jgi:hypothetical protein
MNNLERAQCEAENWWEAAHDKDPVAKVQDNLCGYGLEDWARELLAEEIVALVKLSETRGFTELRKAVIK